jgi:hypothetical protein
MLNRRQDLDRQALNWGFAGPMSGFGHAYRPFVQLPRLNRFLTSFSRQIRIQLSLRFVEGVFRIHSGPVSCGIRFFHLLSEESNLRIDGLRFRFALPAGSSAACSRRQLFVGGFHVATPARLNGLVQFVQGGIGLVCGLSYSAFFKQPPEYRPVHGFSHERLSLFNFGELSHGALTIARDNGKVQRDSVVVLPVKNRRSRLRKKLMSHLILGGAALQRVCELTFRAILWSETPENQAPEGRPNLAQRFSAGDRGKDDSSPGGTTEFSYTLHTLQRCVDCFVVSSALQFAEKLDLFLLSGGAAVHRCDNWPLFSDGFTACGKTRILILF